MAQLLVSCYGFYPNQKKKFKKLMADSNNSPKELKDGIYEFSNLTKNEIENLISDLGVWEKRYGFELDFKITHRPDETNESKRSIQQRLSLLEQRVGIKESTRLTNSILPKILNWYIEVKPNNPIDSIQNEFGLSEEDAYEALDFIKEYLKSYPV